MILTAYGEIVQCDKAIKGTDFIKAFLDGDSVLGHSGISDFSGYSLADSDGNSVKFDTHEPTDTERISALESALFTAMMRGVFNV